MSDPETAHSSRRYVGMRFDSERAGAVNHVDRFAPFKQVRIVSTDLKSAVAAGTLVMCSPVVEAASHDEADIKIKTLAKSKKGDS